MSAPRQNETEIQDAIRLELGRERDLVLWRNNLGNVERWDHRSGNTIRAHAGLPPGSPDLVGILTVEHGGASVGRFFALEVKTPHGRTAPARALAQEQFRSLIRAKGGFAAVVRSPAEARAALERARAGASE